MLQNKTAVIYGGGGAIGGAVARVFAREGAKVFLTGQSLQPLEKVEKDINSSGGWVRTARVDATNEYAVNKHMRSVFEIESQLDISFNAVGIPQTGIQGTPLLELSPESFTLPISTYSMSHFLTAKAAAKHMVGNKTGVIITLTATPASVAAPLVGGMASAWAAIEGFTRTLAGEVGPSGVRVICLRPDAIPETDTITEVFSLHAKGSGMKSHKEFQSLMEDMTLMKRLPTLDEVANTAAFIASDRAGAMTGTVINLSCGSVMD